MKKNKKYKIIKKMIKKLNSSNIYSINLKLYPKLNKMIFDSTSFLNYRKPSNTERIYCIMHNIKCRKEMPLCKNCNKEVHFNKKYNHYNQYCCIDCANKYSSKNNYKNKYSVNLVINSLPKEIEINININNLKNTYEDLINRKNFLKYVTPLFDKKDYKEFDLNNLEYHAYNKYKCNICGKEFYDWVDNKKLYPKCPNCFSNTKSFPEKELLFYICSIYNGKIIESDKSVLSNGRELDIYLPDKHIAFEFDGLYWHSDLFKNKNYHIEKTIECKKKGIVLIHIFEDEWIYKNKLVKYKINKILNDNFNNNNIIYSRKCFIRKVNPLLEKQFLDKNDINKYRKSEIRLGLFYNTLDGTKLVSLMTFKQLKNCNYQLLSFADDIDYNISGSFNDLFKYFKNHYLYNIIYLNIDRRWPLDVNFYLKYKFIFDKYTDIDYWYIKKTHNKSIRKDHNKYNRDKLKKSFKKYYNDNKSKISIMHDAGYICIWDCGYITLMYN